MNAGLRRVLEDAFQTEVINFYGASESLALGVEKQVEEGMILFDDLNVIEVIDGEMYVTCLYNFTQPLIRYHISDKLVLREAEAGGFTRTDVLLCRSEDVLWFERAGGTREYLHPLSMEGFCVEGLRDYQFHQISGTSFEMLAETEVSADRESVREKIGGQIGRLLAEKELENVSFSVRFVEQIAPDAKTGKKPLIIKIMEDMENDENNYYGKAI